MPYAIISTLRLRQNGRHFADDIFKCIYFNENVRISFEVSLKFVLRVLINNILALVQIMAWRRPGDKPLSEPIMVILLTHICIIPPQWVKPQWVKPTLLRSKDMDYMNLLIKASLLFAETVLEKFDVRKYRKTSNIRCTLGNKIVDHSDVVGASPVGAAPVWASPVGAAPTTSSFSTWHLASRDLAKTAARQYENLLSVGIWCDLY